MAGPYNPPNPYGSYFSFGDVQQASMSSFLPFQGGLSPGTMGAMGRGSGGFNPTPSEYLLNRVNNEQMARFMSDVYRGDPRTTSFTNMALQAMYGADSKRRQATVERMGGMGNFQEMIGYLMSQPGISGFLGGSSASLGIGSYALAASGGFGVNNKTMSGDGRLTQMMASAILDQVKGRFYGGAGAAMPGMTQGLNRDQLGGLMTMMASQGAFQGMDLGKLTQSPGQAPKFHANPTALNQLTQTIKDGAKALGAIMDVYGDASVSELFSKAQQITGLNFGSSKNASLMAQRLGQLRQIGTSTGVDVQTMFDASKMGVTMAQSMGLSGHMAAFAGSYSAGEAAKLSRAVAFGRNIDNGGFIPSMGELNAGKVRDIAGMSMDPIGMRRMAVKILEGRGGFDEKTKAQVNEMMATAGPGGINEHQIDAFMRGHGYDLPSMIRQFGGAPGLMRNLSGLQAEDVTRSNMGDMRKRTAHLIGSRMLGGTFGRAAGDAMTLIGDLQADTIQSMITASSANDGGASMNKLMKEHVVMRRDPNRYSQAISNVMMQAGGAETARGWFGMTDMAIRTNPLTSNFVSREAEESAARAEASRTPILTGDDRGDLRRTTMDGILSRYGGTDVRSAYARIALSSGAGAIAGIMGDLRTPGENDIFDSKRMAGLVTQFQKQFAGSQAGRDMLRELNLVGPDGKNTLVENVNLQKFHNLLTSSSDRGLLFRNFQEMRMQSPDGRTSSSFVPKTMIESMQQYGGLVDVAKMVVKKTQGDQGWQGKADFLMATGLALSDPDFAVREVRNGTPGRTIRKMDAQEAQDRANDLIRSTTSLDVLQKIGATSVKDLGHMNQQWGQAAANVLAQAEQDFSTKDDPATRKWIRETRDALKSVGIASRDQPSTMRIVGSLRLGDRELEFMEGTKAQMK